MISPRHVTPIALFLVGISHAQFGAPQLISNQPSGPYDVFAADLDGDGDQDVLSTSLNDDRVDWYENLGSGGFGPRQMIGSHPGDNPVDVYAADLDGDGDVDVLSATYLGREVMWYENLGSGAFGPAQVLGFVNGAREIFAADLDGDGDSDVLAVAETSDKVILWENLGSGTFGPNQVISTVVDRPNSLHATDLDGDGDIDVVSAGRNLIAWHENDGAGLFVQHLVAITPADSYGVFTADLDGDGDSDVIAANWVDVTWYENTASGSIFVPHTITTQADGAYAVYATDLDGDGDTDVLSGSLDDDKIAWYENMGSGVFGPQQVVALMQDGGGFAFAIDLDGDGGADVVSADSGLDTISWHQNLGFVGSIYCTGIANSTYERGRIAATGSTLVSGNDVTLLASHLPQGSFGFFLTSQTQGTIAQPGSSVGVLCLSGNIGRYVGAGQILNSGTAGYFSLAIDLTQHPTPTGLVSVAPGETWNFQAWHRDSVSGVATSNFTDAVEVVFL